MDLHIQSHRAALEQMQPFHFKLQIQLNLGNKYYLLLSSETVFKGPQEKMVSGIDVSSLI
jgi:hypothetical protein